jgi:hypothetical protein
VRPSNSPVASISCCTLRVFAISRATALQSIAEDSGPVTFAACGYCFVAHPAMISAADRMNIFQNYPYFI